MLFHDAVAMMEASQFQASVTEFDGQWALAIDGQYFPISDELADQLMDEFTLHEVERGICGDTMD